MQIYQQAEEILILKRKNILSNVMNLKYWVYLLINKLGTGKDWKFHDRALPDLHDSILGSTQSKNSNFNWGGPGSK